MVTIDHPAGTRPQGVVPSSLGLRNRDIGERLFISERTVARHLVQINAKLGVTNRTAAVRVAQEMGLLSPRELGTTP
jgi:DNA-binding CsgD family transcriptional regulator